MGIPYDIKVYQACQRLNSKIVLCKGIKPNDVTNLITTDESGTEISLDKTAVEAKIKEIEAELATVKYQDDRRAEYPDIGTQLDYIYHNGIDKWKTDMVDPIKAKYPKPE